MEIKVEETYNKLLCIACLCVGRNIYKITNENLIKYFNDALDEIPLNKSMPYSILRLCWECRTNLQRCWSFKEQVKDSHRIMQCYTSENFHECFHTDSSKSSRFNIHKADSINILPSVFIGTCASPYDMKGEPHNVEFFEDSSANQYEDELLPTYDRNLKDLSNVPSPLDAKEGRNSPSENESYVKLPAVVEVKGEMNGSWQYLNEDTSNNLKEEDTISFENNILDNNKLETELQTIISSIEREDVKIKKSNAAVKRRRDDTTTHLKENSIIESLDNVLDDTKLESELQTIISSIEREDNVKKRNRIKSKVKKSRITTNSLKCKEAKLPKYEPKVLTIELSYEEMLLEREKESTRKSYTKAEYKCDTCLLGFNYKKSYLAHVNGKHAPELGEYICPICKTIISSVDSFTSHYKRHMRRYECGICRKRTLDLKVMQQHFFSSHDISLKEYKCNICGKISNSVDTHRYHKDSHKARVQCSECDKTFRHRAGLLNHRLAVHEFHNAFPCNVCDKVFRWKTSLKRHLEKHDVKDMTTPAAPYCSMCSITFSSICSYQRHLKSSLKHVTQDQHKFICDDCGRRFSDKTKLRDHIEEKHLKKTYQCHVCSKQSKNRVGLDQHIRNVHKGRPKNKICHHCGRGFPTKMQLESHIRTHTGERPFICEYCPTTFSQRSNLYKHNRQVHLNIKSKRYLCKKRTEDQIELNKAPSLEAVEESGHYRPIVIHYSPEAASTLIL